MGRLPLAGKFAVHATFFSVIAATNPLKRWVSYVLFVGLVGFLTYGHGNQAIMGIEATFFASPLWAKIISIIYMAINTCVIVLHIYLAYRATKCVRRKQYSKAPRKHTDYSWREIITAAAVTLGGQLIFTAQYLWYFPY
jgi:predicted membrane protein